MANTLTPYFQTVVAAASEASQTLVYNLGAINSIYWDFKPESATLGSTLNIAIPGITTSSVVDAGSADMILTDVSAATVPVLFNLHPRYAMVFTDWEQVNTPVLLRNTFLDAAMKGVQEAINGWICALYNTTNFNVNASIATTGGLITTTQFLAARAILSDRRVPVRDRENMSLLTGSTPYTKILNDATWTSAQIASDRRADVSKTTGIMPTSYGATLVEDQQMPATGSVGARTFTSCYFHKWAVAGVTRPLPRPDPRTTEFMYINFGGIPIRVTLSYNHYPKQGWVVSVDAGLGLKVVRPEMGQIFTTAE